MQLSSLSQPSQPFSYQSAEEVIANAIAFLQSTLERDHVFTSVDAVRQFLRLRLGRCECEYFGIMFLDNQHRLIKFVELFRGTIDCAAVYPREVVKEALAFNAAAIILAHNHPSGVAEPSSADRHITTQIRDALALVDIRVLDHFVVTAVDSVSFAERGWI